MSDINSFRDGITYLRSFFATDLAMDLGTANTLIHARGQGIVVNEPSVVAIDKRTKKVVAVGTEAKMMFGKTPQDIMTIRPMKDGVIADFDAAKVMISSLIRKTKLTSFILKPKIIIGVPSGITQVEKKAVIESAMETGMGEVYLVEEPMAAAIGTKMPVGESRANLIVDIGGGTTEVAIISMYATAYSESIRVAGDELDEAIVRYLRKNHGIDVGVFEAERVKIHIGSAFDSGTKLETEVAGRDIVNGLPKRVTVDDAMIRAAMADPVKAIVESVYRALHGISAEMAADVTSRGVVLAGGGALIRGLDKRIQQDLGLPVSTSPDPLTAIVRGAGTVLEEFNTYRRVIIN
ncbi:MAG: rod shape-determining protein [Nitrospinae bacterium]|nr:rod shape-determining protein [Nitrospinota bacterium]